MRTRLSIYFSGMSDERSSDKIRCAVLYNHVGEDSFEKLRDVDPASLLFVPEYNIHVATVTEEYEALVRALAQEGFEATLLNLEDDLGRLQELCERQKPDVVFNLVEIFHGDPALEAAVAGVLDLHKIPYTGASPFVLELCQRKALTKLILMREGIPTPRFKLLTTPEIPQRHGLRYPLIVKPAREDASLGVDPGSVVRELGQLQARVAKIFEQFNQPALVEEYVDGKELHIAVIGNSPPESLPIIEFDFAALPEDHPPIITFDVKWNPLEFAYHRVHSRCPAQLEPEVEQQVRQLAVQAFEATGCRDYARIDLRLTPDLKPFILEVNPNPDLTEGVSFMEAAEIAGYNFSRTIRRIVECALARGNAQPFAPAESDTVQRGQEG